jgi:two-component system invasion response regulator UvrY
MIRVLMVDDHAIVRKGLRQIVTEESGNMAVGEAATAEETLKLLYNERWDVLVLDISLPDRNGLDLLHEIKQQYPDLPVLVLSMHSEEQYALRVLRTGASGYINKESAPAELVEAIEKVVTGGTYISSALAEMLAYSINKPAPAPLHETLSNREYTVLLQLGAGRSVGEIAEDLNLSVKTISTYRRRLLEKMNLSTTAELIRYVIEHQLV